MLEDIYFEERYGKLYETIEGGQCEVFEFEHVLGKVRHQFIKKPIPIQLEGRTYHDLVTPYGYGGPLLMGCKNSDRKELAGAFAAAFESYCAKNSIVSEFIRFHPVISNEQDFSGCYELVFRRYTTGTNLKDFENPVQHEYSKSKQKSIRKALEAGVTFRVTRNPENLAPFMEIYYGTMDRNQADSVYYFDEVYFKNLLQMLGPYVLLVEVLFENKVIGMGLNLVYGRMIHIHLSGTLDDYRHMSPAFILRYALAEWGKANGIELIHEGGGRTGNPEDPLYILKKQFGKNTEFRYFVSYKIWNDAIYHALCEAADVKANSGFFPAYRQQQKKIEDAIS